MFDDDPPKKPPVHEIGSDLSALSAHELEERIALLKDEITRLEAAIEARGRTKDAAQSFFQSG